MKRLLKFGLLSMLLVMFLSSCGYIHDSRENKQTLKLQKKINAALAKDDFVAAHQYLGELLLFESYYWDDRKKASVRDVYLAEMRYLVSKNDESSWNRAIMLPMEVPEKYSYSLKNELYRALYDYAVELDNKEIEEKTAIKLGIKTEEKNESEDKIVKIEEKMIMPVSTSIAGPNGDLFAVVGKKDGYKLVVNEKSWSITVEIKRVKNGEVKTKVILGEEKGKWKTSVRQFDYNIILKLLDEDNVKIAQTYNTWVELSGLSVGQTHYLTFTGNHNVSNMKVAKFEVFSIKGSEYTRNVNNK